MKQELGIPAPSRQDGRRGAGRNQGRRPCLRRGGGKASRYFNFLILYSLFIILTATILAAAHPAWAAVCCNETTGVMIRTYDSMGACGFGCSAGRCYEGGCPSPPQGACAFAMSSDTYGECRGGGCEQRPQHECTASGTSWREGASCDVFRQCATIPPAAADCVIGTSCPTGQVPGGGPCPGPGQIQCITAPQPAATPAGATATPTAVELPNPLGETDFAVILGRIIKMMVGGVGMIALLVFIYGGFQWLTAAGNPEKIKKGKDILLWSVIGMVVMLSAYLVVRYIAEALLTGTVNP